MIEIDNVSLWSFCGIIAFFLLGILAKLTLFFRGFSRELRYINNEITRTEAGERKYWCKQRRRLWLSLLPFVKYN